MESTLKMLSENPYAWAILALITIASLIIAIYSWVTGKGYKRLTYTKKANKLISLKTVGLKTLQLFFNGTEITDVSITRIAVWNSGKDTVEIKDLASLRPLKIMVKDNPDNHTEILDCSLDFLTDEDMLGKDTSSILEIIDNTIEVPFEYINKNNGMIIQVIHTGEPEDIYADCQIKGGRKFDEVENDGARIRRNTNLGRKIRFSERGNWLAEIFLYIQIILSVFIILIIPILSLLKISEKQISQATVLLVIILFIIAGLIVYPLTTIALPRHIKEKL